MSVAGFAKTEFPFAQSHSVFLRHFIKASKLDIQTASYWGSRTGESGGQPVLGDIVAFARGKNMTPASARALFDSTRLYESHSDLVVAARDGEIDVIGCDVLSSMTMKTLQIDPNGHIHDDRQLWLAVLKRRQLWMARSMFASILPDVDQAGNLRLEPLEDAGRQSEIPL